MFGTFKAQPVDDLIWVEAIIHLVVVVVVVVEGYFCNRFCQCR